MFRLMVLISMCVVAYGCPRIVTRTQWGARAPRCSISRRVPVPLVIMHHTVSGSCTNQAACSAIVRGIQSDHIQRPQWCDIGYNFLVGEDGNVYEGQGWVKTGHHAAPKNTDSVGISVIGNFAGRVPNAAAQKAIHALIACGVRLGYIKPDYVLKGHRNINPTACPGQSFYNLITRWARFRAS